MGTNNRAVLISNAITRGLTITGTINAMSHERYTGSYDVTPEVIPQTLPTKNLVMSNDVSIKAIPSYRVTNAAGGDTFTIGAMNV